MDKRHQNYLTVSWEQVLCNNDQIEGLFKVLEIGELKNIRVLSRTYSDDGRMIINVTADNADDKTFRVIIDSTPGIPIWQQFINVTYDQGESSDIRIILYGEDDREYRSTAGGILEIGNLVRRNNQCGVITYLVNGIGFDSNGRKYQDGCHLEEGPNNVQANTRVTLPSKRQVQEAEFWAGYYSPQREYEYIDIDIDDDIINGWAPGYSVRNDLRTEALWNDEGFFIKLIEEKPSDAIHWIWNNKKSEFEAAYPNCDITLEKIDDKRYAISVRILNISMTNLINMTPQEKWDYGEHVFVQEHAFYDVAEVAAHDYNDVVKAASVA